MVNVRGMMLNVSNSSVSDLSTTVLLL